MLKKIADLLYSTKTMAFLVVIFFVSMAVATFIENDFGTPAAKAWVYNARWFELLMLLLAVNFIGNLFRFRLYRKEKWPVFLFHLAFLIVLLGAFVTRYFGYEGIMPIREGTRSDFIYSDKAYVMATVDNGKWQKSYAWPVLFNRLGPNRFDVHEVFGPKKPHPFELKLLRFVPHAKEVFRKDPSGPNYIHLIDASVGMRRDIFLKEGDVKNINNILFTFNAPIKGALNFRIQNGRLMMQSPIAGKLMDMKAQRITAVPKDSLVPVTTGQLYQLADVLKFVVSEVDRGHTVLEPAPKAEESRHPFDALEMEVKAGNERKKVTLRGRTGAELAPKEVQAGGLNFRLNYGSQKIKLPFAIYLRDFVMKKYPGTHSPSSYESFIKVLDRDSTFDYHIYMNHVLDYKGYRFYQSSYDPDEKGTVLSVNHDFWGTHITYLGYILLAVGMFWALFRKGTRFDKLSRQLQRLSKNKKMTVWLLALFVTGGIYGQNISPAALDSNTVSKAHAEKFGRLLVQDHQGRIKPVNTYALEILRKIYKHDTYKGKTADQVALSAIVRPDFWARQKIIKTKPYALGSKLSAQLKVDKNGLTSIIHFFTPRGYVLENRVAEAYRKRKALRTATDVEIINLDEKVNIWLAALRGELLHIYPKQGDSLNKWYNGFDHRAFTGQDTLILSMHRLYLSEVDRAMHTGDYSKADEYLQLISDYQRKIGKDIIPPQSKIDLEIAYNKWNIFKKLLFYYMLLGFLMLILAFTDLFLPGKRWIRVAGWILSGLLILGLLAHAVGMGIRWYISGHEPWSNGYEAVVFVAFVAALVGLIFSFKRSLFIVAVSTVFASFLMGIAHGSLMNPQITNLVPVLKSYWLMIHVAVITSSYGFLGLSAMLGLTVLILYIIWNSHNKERIKALAKELTLVNEMSMTIGLYTLTIGTFLGGVWANESWGRYWSWDPKEVWSLISMMVYVFILHMRIVPGLRGQFAFNMASLFSVATLIMTFFGVNYYLSGMHSYATGDPVPIPLWVPVTTLIFIILTAVSYWRYRQLNRKEKDTQ